MDALSTACQTLGLEVSLSSDRPAGELVIGGTVVDVLARAVAQPVGIPQRPTVVVADQVGGTTREALREAGVGWLDRRGHLYLPMLSPALEAAIKPLPRDRVSQARETEAFGRGRATIEVAVDLLIEQEPTGVRQLAAEVGLSPGAISMARRRLREAFLLSPGNQPLLPELFEALAEVWRPSWQALSHDPAGPVDASPGAWIRTGDVAAAVLGAPMAVGGAAPGQYYMRTARQVREAVHRFGPSGDAQARSWVAVAPSRLAVTRASERIESLAAPWTSGPVAPPAVVALELAQDPGRGAEILADWHLDGGSPWRTR